MDLTSQRLTELARYGAEVELARIARARQDILAMFPDLDTPPQSAVTTSVDHAVAQAMPPKQRRRRMSPTQRKDISQRMKAYWAAQRSAKAGR